MFNYIKKMFKRVKPLHITCLDCGNKVLLEGVSGETLIMDHKTISDYIGDFNYVRASLGLVQLTDMSHIFTNHTLARLDQFLYIHSDDGEIHDIMLLWEI